MKTKTTDNWEVELTNDNGDTLTLKGEWYADFFKEYDNKQLIIADVVWRIEQLKADEETLVKGEEWVADYVKKNGKDLTSL